LIWSSFLWMLYLQFSGCHLSDLPHVETSLGIIYETGVGTNIWLLQCISYNLNKISLITLQAPITPLVGESKKNSISNFLMWVRCINSSHWQECTAIVNWIMSQMRRKENLICREGRMDALQQQFRQSLSWWWVETQLYFNTSPHVESCH
jgi:hypothetical protein